MIKEELYKWYDIVDEGEYWTDYDTALYRDDIEKISTIITNGKDVWTYQECSLGWGLMAKMGCWKYMRVKID